MEEDIQNHLLTVMFRGTPCIKMFKTNLNQIFGIPYILHFMRLFQIVKNTNIKENYGLGI